MMLALGCRLMVSTTPACRSVAPGAGSARVHNVRHIRQPHACRCDSPRSAAGSPRRARSAVHHDVALTSPLVSAPAPGLSSPAAASTASSPSSCRTGQLVGFTSPPDGNARAVPLSHTLDCEIFCTSRWRLCHTACPAIPSLVSPRIMMERPPDSPCDRSGSRQVGRKIRPRRVDRRCTSLRSVDVAAQIELNGDVGRAQPARRGHPSPRDVPKLPLSGVATLEP